MFIVGQLLDCSVAAFDQILALSKKPDISARADPLSADPPIRGEGVRGPPNCMVRERERERERAREREREREREYPSGTGIP